MTPVHASCSGVVRVAQWVSGFRGGYGNAVEILCDAGPLTLYAHNTKLIVHVGESVTVGQLISYSGSTGNSTGPHLHFGVKVNGTWENPMNFLPPR
jgi:murein DD-endopeptidase MepM/ murein hydrolase activator NlpD